MRNSKYWKYFTYILKHKYYVFIAGWYLGAPLWRLITHDLSKLLPSEWFPYMDYFYDQPKRDRGVCAYGFPCEGAPYGAFLKDRFTFAWLLHQHRNPHHWQYWIMREDSGKTFSVGIPRDYLLEMIADWAGAGRAITGKWDLHPWWFKNKDKMMLREEDKQEIDRLVTILDCRLAEEFGLA